MIESQIQQSRDELQRDALHKLLTNKRLIVEWGTGVGKSRVAIEAVDTLYNRGKCRILLLVTETQHKENWRREFVEAKGEERGNALFNACIVECYASLHKYQYSYFHYIIADEAHHLRGDLKRSILGNIGAEYVLCLSATLSCRGDGSSLLSLLEDHFGTFESTKFTVQNAIDNGILSTPKIIVHLLPLSDIKGRQTIHLAWGTKAKRVELKCNFEEMDNYSRYYFPHADLTVSCTAKQAYEFLCGEINRTKAAYGAARKEAGLETGDPDTQATAWAYNKMVRAGGDRKELLGNCKTNFLKWLIQKMGQTKFICFCATVDQAVEVGGDNVIHSSSDKDNGDVIRAFNNGEITSLFAVNMIQEGQNLAGIQAGIIVQLGGKDRTFIQKFGRTLRSKNPVQHIIAISGTKDDDFLKVALAGINDEYITFYQYGSLRNKPLAELFQRNGNTPVQTTTAPQSDNRPHIRGLG